MAFFGLFLAGVVLLILGVLLLLGVIFLIVGIVLRVKGKKTPSLVFLILGALSITAVAVLVIIAVMPKPKSIETPEGTATIKASWYRRYDDYLENGDTASLRKLVNAHPELVYYYDVNRVMLLDYGLYNCDIEIMQIALDNGARFDEPLRYDHMTFCSSLDSFFGELDYPAWEKDESQRITPGETTDEMIAALEFAIDNGACMTWDVPHDYQTDNMYELTKQWVTQDGVTSPKDRELLEMLENKLGIRS